MSSRPAPSHRESVAGLREILGFFLQKSGGFDHELKEAGFLAVNRAKSRVRSRC